VFFASAAGGAFFHGGEPDAATWTPANHFAVSSNAQDTRAETW